MCPAFVWARTGSYFFEFVFHHVFLEKIVYHGRGGAIFILIFATLVSQTEGRRLEAQLGCLKVYIELTYFPAE